MSDDLRVRDAPLEEWDVQWLRCQHTNLLQSRQYGSAKEESNGWRSVRLIVDDRDRQPVALAQVLIRAFPVLGGIARLNRGPLLIDDWPAPEGRMLALAVLRALPGSAPAPLGGPADCAGDACGRESLINWSPTDTPCRPAWGSVGSSQSDETTLLMKLDRNGATDSARRRRCRRHPRTAWAVSTRSSRAVAPASEEFRRE